MKNLCLLLLALFQATVSFLSSHIYQVKTWTDNVAEVNREWNALRNYESLPQERKGTIVWTSNTSYYSLQRKLCNVFAGNRTRLKIVGLVEGRGDLCYVTSLDVSIPAGTRNRRSLADTLYLVCDMLPNLQSLDLSNVHELLKHPIMRSIERDSLHLAKVEVGRTTQHNSA